MEPEEKMPQAAIPYRSMEWTGGALFQAAGKYGTRLYINRLLKTTHFTREV